MTPPLTISDLIRSAQREAAMRRRVYLDSRLSPETKAHEIAAIDSIVDLLGALKATPAAQELLAAAGWRFSPEPQDPQPQLL